MKKSVLCFTLTLVLTLIILVITTGVFNSDDDITYFKANGTVSDITAGVVSPS